MLLCLDRLMETIAVAAARHDTASELIDDQNLIILYHIILVAVHEIVRTKREDDAVLDLKIFRIGEVLDMEELLHLLHALLGEVDGFLLFIDNEIARFLDLFTEDGIDLRKFCGFLTALELPRQYVTDLIESCRLAGGTGNNKRCSRFINEHRIDLIDDAVMKAAEHLLLLINCHVITEVVEAKLIVRNVGDIAVVGCLALLSGHRI